MIAALMLAAAALCPNGICSAGTLAPVFAKLERSRDGGGRPVHILQIGDSHTAGDAVTGGWRDLLQARYGIGGRGVLPPGRPYDGYLTRGITATMSPGWSIAADFGKGSAPPRPPLGLSAFSLTSQADGATMALDAEPQQRFTRAVVCAILRPGAGTLTIRIGTASQRWELASINERPECRTVRSAAPETHLDLLAAGGPVTLTSWATFAEAGGVVLSNLGVVGSQLVHFARTDDAVLAEELRTYAPDLIVLAFGTNEGFAPRFTAFDYEIVLRTQIGRLRRLAGNVPILLLGAPDALTRRPELKTNAAEGDASPCGNAPVPAAPAATPATGFAGAMQRLGGFLGVEAAGEGAASAPTAPAPSAATVPPVRPGLFPPAGLDAVRAVQRRVATSLHVAFWDWQAAMGGRCTALRWVRASPPLMRGDYVHYTSAGGRVVAARLQADLDKAAGR